LQQKTNVSGEDNSFVESYTCAPQIMLPRASLSTCGAQSVPSPRGDLVGLSPPNKAPSCPNWSM